MYLSIYSFGEIKNKQLKELSNYFLGLAGKYANIKRIQLKNIEGRKIGVKDLHSKIFDDTLVVLSERGNALTSDEFINQMEKFNDSGIHINFLLGNSFGLEEDIIRKAKLTMSLSKLTFNHEIAYMILAEQLYRSLNKLAGGSYHK